jgi:ATP-dependent exoDNAse (exonuclease V) beta subunit
LTSVTTLVHKHFSVFNADLIITKMMKGPNWNEQNPYWGLSPLQIKDLWTANANEACRLGTLLHNNIEKFMNSTTLPYPYTLQQLLDEYMGHEEGELKKEQEQEQDQEWKYFLNFARDYGDKIPYRTEWRIFDVDTELSGSIDMVFVNPEDGSLSIYDWKRAKEIKKESKFKSPHPLMKHIPDVNFYQYSLQLNVYKKILEKTYGRVIRDLFLVIMHPNSPDYQVIECADLSKEVEDIFRARTKKDV